MNKKKLLALVMALVMALSLAVPAVADGAPGDNTKPVDGGNSTYVPTREEAEEYVKTAGWMTGTGNGFAPEQLVDRATMYEMFWKMEGKPQVANKMATFPDAEGKWFETSARWAEQEGLTQGTGNGYEGERVITRAEVLTILYRYMKDYKKLDVSQGDGWYLTVFEDCDDIQDWAEDAMRWGWISGVACQPDTDPTIKPNAQVKRIDLAKMLTVMSTYLPRQTADYVAYDVSYENDGRTVPAVVTMPKGVTGAVPAVVLAHGHGGSKDENTGFGGVAAALAKAGIASIRMDYPGCGDSAESFQKNTMTNMVSDTMAGVKYLTENYNVDAKSLGIVGYSMGGRIASTIVGREDDPFAAVVLLSAADGAADGDLAVNLFGSLEKYNELKAAADKDGYAVFTTIYGQVQELSKEWFADMEAGKPLEDLAKFEGPVLVLHGDEDTMITDAMNKENVKAARDAAEIVVPGADHGYGFYSDQPDVTANVEGAIVDFFGQFLRGKVTGLGKRMCEETVVELPVAEADGIPAHTVIGTLCAPDALQRGNDGRKYPAVVMLHGTGSNRDEAGNGYAMGAPILAGYGVVSLRIDFMGNGDSAASYTDYNYTSANLDAKAAADYLATLDYVDADKIAVMGWSQGGTNALLAAAAYPETFSAVVTWAGALDLTTMFDNFDAAYETAKNGGYEMTFEWRDSLMVGERWFKEVDETNVLDKVAAITAPICAIYGTEDDTVDPSCAEQIAAAAQVGYTCPIQGADHTYNVFAEEDAGYPTLYSTVWSTAYFLVEQAYAK